MVWRAGDVLAAVSPRPSACHVTPAGIDAPSTLPPVSLTINDAVRFSGLGKTSLYESLARGDIAGVRVGRRTLILADSLRAFIEKQPTYHPTMGRKIG